MRGSKRDAQIEVQAADCAETRAERSHFVMPFSICAKKRNSGLTHFGKRHIVPPAIQRVKS
jgi:hypothetical protein